MLAASYILPIRCTAPAEGDELTNYLHWLSAHLEVIVVDGSPPPVFAAHAARWAPFVLHIPPDPDQQTTNGKVGGVLTGIKRARHERLIIADDDVRYDLPALSRLVALLQQAEIVRPQNYFDPLPWHARWDTARTLLNRVTGGDWPGTVGVTRSLLLATGGYDGEVLFENLELSRTMRAAGGRELVPLDLYVRRLPPTARHFCSQRIRQAYDELARPWRLLLSLALLPMVALLLGRRAWRLLSLLAALLIVLAESGRRRAGGRRIFPLSATLLAPIWCVERALCSWLALGARLFLGGVPYRGKVLQRAATPMRTLRQRHGQLRATRDPIEAATGTPLAPVPYDGPDGRPRKGNSSLTLQHDQRRDIEQA